MASDRRFLRVLLFCLTAAAASNAQSVPSPGPLRAVIVLARHGVRAPIESETRSGAFNSQPWPAWPVAPGLLTAHGAEVLRLSGEYYRARYASLLSGADCAHPRIYAEANNSPRTLASAKAMLNGLAPGCQMEPHSRKQPPNPLFVPPRAGSGLPVNQPLVTDATLGRMGGQPAWFAHAFARPLGLMEETLAGCTGASCRRARPTFARPWPKTGLWYRATLLLRAP